MSKIQGGKIVAVYARCSTTKDQQPEVQLIELRRFCEARGWVVSYEVVDRGFSGSTDKRPGLKQLMDLVTRRKIDVVVVVKLDRLFRSLKHMVLTLQEMEDLGVEFVSLKDNLDLTTASGRLMLHVLSAMAEFERALISERTVAGLDYARSKGKHLGRPKTVDDDGILQLRANGLSFRKIMKELNCSMGAVNRALGAAPKTSTETDQNNHVGTRVSNA